MKRTLRIALPLLLAAAACSSNNSSNSTITSVGTLTNEIITGTVAPPVNGTRQTDTKTFTVKASGELDVTLTSAIESLPSGQFLTTVTVGLAIGNWSGTTCTAISGASTNAQAGSSPQISGNVQAGTYCVMVTDVTNQLGPVQYALSVDHT